jgi:hypothetical protein
MTIKVENHYNLMNVFIYHLNIYIIYSINEENEHIINEDGSNTFTFGTYIFKVLTIKI